MAVMELNGCCNYTVSAVAVRTAPREEGQQTYSLFILLSVAEENQICNYFDDRIIWILGI